MGEDKRIYIIINADKTSYVPRSMERWGQERGREMNVQSIYVCLSCR